MTETLFYDSTQPGKLPHALVALYCDGDYAAGETGLGEFSGIKWITVLGNQFAQIADFEPRNAVYENETALARWAGGMQHQGVTPIVYTDLGNLPLVRERLGPVNPHRPYWVWAATLDGNKLSADYTPGLWGVQFAGGPTANYDISVLYGEW